MVSCFNTSDLSKSLANGLIDDFVSHENNTNYRQSENGTNDPSSDRKSIERKLTKGP